MFADAAEVADNLAHHGLEHFRLLAEMAFLIQGGRGPVPGFPACGQVVTEEFPAETQVLKVTPENLDFLLQRLASAVRRADSWRPCRRGAMVPAGSGGWPCAPWPVC